MASTPTPTPSSRPSASSDDATDSESDRRKRTLAVATPDMRRPSTVSSLSPGIQRPEEARRSSIMPSDARRSSILPSSVYNTSNYSRSRRSVTVNDDDGSLLMVKALQRHQQSKELFRSDTKRRESMAPQFNELTFAREDQ
ncbi:hypothetical protein AC578_3307 [Pseudocercospora eumusae]|uniref:Uncharacterized protein n=1 Tax=Pseudocercospora eumusae TaxID=321146 RepID=A0A139HCL3_9PEZI|nr:hypothetical protein AC578_3307 [Pseudocercospora eumusae]